MKEIKINIPTEFTIEHYQKLGQFEHLSEIEKIIRIISAISNYEEDFIRTSLYLISLLFLLYE